MKYLNTRRLFTILSFILRPLSMEPCCANLTASQPEPSLSPTGRKSMQFPSGSERSIPLTYLNSKHRISSIFAMRIWQNIHMDLNYTQLKEGEERIWISYLRIRTSPLYDHRLSTHPYRHAKDVYCSTRLSD